MLVNHETSTCSTRRSNFSPRNRPCGACIVDQLSSFFDPSLPGTARRPARFRRAAVKSEFRAASKAHIRLYLGTLRSGIFRQLYNLFIFSGRVARWVGVAYAKRDNVNDVVKTRRIHHIA